ncbi:MAG: site-specific DNA-methyltransferase [Candidatus Helarchaeota archaeon]
MNGIKLTYLGKLSKAEVLSSTPMANLKIEKMAGEKKTSDEWNNFLIHGDCLNVLKTLLQDPKLKNKVKLIYIDPPFATKKDFKIGKERTATISMSDKDAVAYADKLSGPEYLEFLRHRLILMRELLADDGSIYVHVDSKVGHYVKIILDEVFGPERYINDISRIKCNPKNFARKAYGNYKDVIYFYSKTRKYIWNDPRDSFTEEDLLRLFPRRDKNGRMYTTNPLHAPGETKNGPTGQPWRGKLPPKGRHWRYSPDVLEDLDQKGLIEWSKTGNPRKIIYADEYVKKGKKKQDVWMYKDAPYPSYPTEKNLEMLKLIISASSNEGDVILDAFAGSGTSLVAAEQLKRRWIGIDSSFQAINVALQRLTSIPQCKIFNVYKTK